MATSEMVNFGVIDYCVFVVSLGASLGIGIYHCVRGNRTTDDFLLASRSMSAAPIALSLTATLVSSIAILAQHTSTLSNQNHIKLTTLNLKSHIVVLDKTQKYGDILSQALKIYFDSDTTFPDTDSATIFNFFYDKIDTQQLHTTRKLLQEQHSLNPTTDVQMEETDMAMDTEARPERPISFTGEVYGHGLQLIWCNLGVVFGTIIAVNVFTPVIYPLKLDSINEYLERRFRSTAVKRLVMFTTSVSSLLYLGVCLYAPTLALESVTPIKSEVYIVLLGSIVTAYSSFGGMKAVVWTDAFQAILLTLGVIVALISATVVAGGPAQVWKTASEHGRTELFDFRVGLFVRHTALNTMMKNTVTFTSMYSFHQTTVQRLATLKSLQQARTSSNQKIYYRVLYLNMVGVVAITLLLFMSGLSVFAAYAGCDPITLGFISKKDQILPYFIMDRMGFLKGVPGLFVACLLCGTMSNLLVDKPQENSVITASTRPHFSAVAFGLTMIGLAFSASTMGGLIQVNNTLLGILAGPNFGIFFLGICVPFCNKKGAVAGMLSAMIFMAWLGIGMQLHAPKPTLLPLHASQCLVEDTVFNATFLTEAHFESTPSTPSLELLTPVIDTTEDTSSSNPFNEFYLISYTFLPIIGATVCLIVGIAVSLVTGRENLEEVMPELILPILRKYLKRKPTSHPFEVNNLLATKRNFRSSNENSTKENLEEQDRSAKSLL
ncbi:Sodium/solute symporter [Trinorchestia longiramus]|nr:Sodium/solute symporter [Trinorchestia longiramus]